MEEMYFPAYELQKRLRIVKGISEAATPKSIVPLYFPLCYNLKVALC